MIAELRRQADEAAQDALRACLKAYFAEDRWDPDLTARYYAAQRLVNMIDALVISQQQADPQAPDYFGLFTTEAEARAAWGDR